MIEQLLVDKKEFINIYKEGIILECYKGCHTCDNKIRKIEDIFHNKENNCYHIIIVCNNCYTITFNEEDNCSKLLSDLKSLYKVITKFIVI